MSRSSRIRRLEERMGTTVENGFCGVCAKKTIGLFYDEPIPPPCPVCGKIAFGVIYIADPNNYRTPEELRGRVNSVISLPDNGRDPRPNRPPFNTVVADS